MRKTLNRRILINSGTSLFDLLVPIPLIIDHLIIIILLHVIVVNIQIKLGMEITIINAFPNCLKLYHLIGYNVWRVRIFQ